MIKQITKENDTNDLYQFEDFNAALRSDTYIYTGRK